MQSHGNQSDCWLLNYAVTWQPNRFFHKLCGAKFCPLWLQAEFTTAHASVLLRCCPMAETPHSFFNTSHVATWVCSPIQHTEASFKQSSLQLLQKDFCQVLSHGRTPTYYNISIIRHGYCLFHCMFCAATIRGWRLLLWKARRHQLWLDKVGMSETVMVARHCH